jgi:antitoxin component of MazEF toxin-antitoxin module
MLKKLVKYGNSSALVLDRSILALLDISEGSTVKLRIEGDTLIIKAAEAVKPTDSLMLEIENIHERVRSDDGSIDGVMNMVEESTRKYCKKIENSPSDMEILKEWLPGTENDKKLQEAYKKIMGKYQNELMTLSSGEFVEDLNTLNKKYQNDTSSDEFREEFLTLRMKHCPKLAKMDEEMKEASLSLGFPVHLYE